MPQIGKASVRQLLVGLVAAMASVFVPTISVAADDQADIPSEWRQTTLTTATVELFAPSSGALLARTDEGVSRSDDGGASWRSISLPPSTSIVRIDPSNHDRLVAITERQPSLSADGGATWAPGGDLPERAIDLTLSAADPTLAYAVTAPRWPSEGSYRILRSRDSLQTWEVLSQDSQSSRCGWSVFLLTAHPTDANRLFLSAECVFGGITSSRLQQSLDQAVTWSPTFARNLEYPRRLLTGSSANPTRLWLSTVRDSRTGGSALHRSDDDGETWMPVLDKTAQLGAEPVQVSEIRGLTTSPLNGDLACVALFSGMRAAGQPPKEPFASGVECTFDAGATWSTLGAPGDGEPRDLAVGIDGANIFAATSTGVWVRPISPPP